MTENVENPGHTIGVVDAFLKEFRFSRVRHFSGDAAVALNVGLSQNPPSDEVSVSLDVTVSEGDAGPDAADVMTASVVYTFVISETLDTLPDALVTGLVQFAWPYLRSALDSITGLAHLQPLPIPMAPPRAGMPSE